MSTRTEERRESPFVSCQAGGQEDRFRLGSIRQEAPMDSKAPLNALRPKVGQCPACGKAVHQGEDFVRVHGDAIHARCGLYKPRSARRSHRKGLKDSLRGIL